MYLLKLCSKCKEENSQELKRLSEIRLKQIAHAKKINANYSKEKRIAAAKKAWETKRKK